MIFNRATLSPPPPPPQGTLCNVWRRFWPSQLEWEYGTGIKCIEVKDATIYPAGHRTMPTVKNDPAPNVSNATVEKPSSSLCVVGGKRWGRALLFWPFSNLRWSLMLLPPVSSACLLPYLFHCPLSFLAKMAPWLLSSGPGCWQCMPSLSRALWFCSILRFCLFQSLSLLVWKQPVCSLPLSFEGS